MLVTSYRTKHLQNLPTSITIGNAQIHIKQSVKNLDPTLDCHHSNEWICLQHCSDMLLWTASFGIYSYIPDNYCNCHNCIFFCFVKNWLQWLIAVWFYSWCDISLAADTEICSSSYLTSSKVIQYNHTHTISTLASCQCKKHIQNSLFGPPVLLQYITIICRWHAA